MHKLRDLLAVFWYRFILFFRNMWFLTKYDLRLLFSLGAYKKEPLKTREKKTKEKKGTASEKTFSIAGLKESDLDDLVLKAFHKQNVKEREKNAESSKYPTNHADLVRNFTNRKNPGDMELD